MESPGIKHELCVHANKLVLIHKEIQPNSLILKYGEYMKKGSGYLSIHTHTYIHICTPKGRTSE